MKAFLNTRILVSIHLLIVAAVVVVGAWSVYSAESDFRDAVTKNIERQVALLEFLAVETDRNGADEVVASIITDCPRRGQFEELLGRLATLNRQELITAQQLFESCGGYYAERKAIMVSRLEREYEVLEDNVALLSLLDEDHELVDSSAAWGELVAMERERSSLLAEQVLLQRDIINLLITGKNVLSSEMQVLTNRAQNVAELLSVTGTQIDAKRIELLK